MVDRSGGQGGKVDRSGGLGGQVDRSGGLGGSTSPRWYTGLLLLGFREVPGLPFTLTPATFDHSNPAAFQHVFHFLLSLLLPARAKTELRDCWPILDKKMEAEFRRKVALLVKEVGAGLVTCALPTTNPALLMSPGGAKFRALLTALVSAAVRGQVEGRGLVLGLPTPSCRGAARRAAYHRLGVFKKEDISAAVAEQGEIKEVEGQAEEVLAEVQEEYFNLKQELEQLTEEGWGEEVEEGEQEARLQEMEVRCGEVREVQERWRASSVAAAAHCEAIAEVTDDTAPRPVLDLAALPHSSSVADTAAALLQGFKEPLATAAEAPAPRLPTAAVAEAAELARGQGAAAGGMREEVRAIVAELGASLEEAREECREVEWGRSALAPSHMEEVELVPPTPSLLPGLSGAPECGLTPRLRLGGPPAPAVAPEASLAPQTPPSLPQLSRRFPRKVTPDQSPLLRRSLLHATLERAEEVGVKEVPREEEVFLSTRSMEQDSTKDSLGVFSPVLSSTLALDRRSTSEVEEAGKEVEKEVKVEGRSVEDTAAKIRHYRAVLGASARLPSAIDAPPPPPQSLSPARAELALAWGAGRALLATTPSPGAAGEWSTPRREGGAGRQGREGRKESEELDTLLTSRLDTLMQDSMVLSDASTLDLSLGGLSLGEPDLLSPHTK